MITSSTHPKQDPYDRPELPLDPELEAHIEQLEHFKALRHPLVMCVPYFDADIMHEQLNGMLKQKRKQLAEAEEARDFERCLVLHERPFRLHAFIAFHLRFNPPPESYWPALAWHWIDAEDPDLNSHIYQDYFTRPYPLRSLLMSEGERHALEELPEQVTVYRGAPEDQRKGLSWTTDLNVARFFATRYGATDPIYTMHVRKKDCIAHFTRRGESELIVHPRAWCDPELHSRPQPRHR